jgi:ribosome assembly protein 4
VETLERSKEQHDVTTIPSDAGSIRLQFVDERTGLPIGGGPVMVPVADANPKNLELLVNKLLGHVGYTSDFGYYPKLRLFSDDA